MTDVFESKRKSVEKWLDQLIKKFQALSNITDCPIKDISACGTLWEKEIHIQKGLDEIAFYLQATVIYNPNWSKRYPDTGEAYFYYKGCRIFTLWIKKEVK